MKKVLEGYVDVGCDLEVSLYKTNSFTKDLNEEDINEETEFEVPVYDLGGEMLGLIGKKVKITIELIGE